MQECKTIRQESLKSMEDAREFLSGVLGVPSYKNFHQEVPAHGPREFKRPQSGPKEAQSEPQMFPREGQGRLHEAMGANSGANLTRK